MARLLGIITRQPVEISLTVGLPQHISMATHGWGVAWYDPTLNIQKGVRSTVNPKTNQPVQKTVTTTTLLFHMRQATSGDISDKNTHPFSYNNYAFAHTGLVSREKLLPLLRPPYNENFQSEPIDSELYFRAIVQFMQELPPHEAIKKVTRVINSDRGANFLLSDGDRIFAYRFGLPLYWMRLYDGKPLSVHTKSGLSLSSSQLGRTVSYIISSEKIIDGSWTAFDDGELLMIRRNLQYENYNLLL